MNVSESIGTGLTQRRLSVHLPPPRVQLEELVVPGEGNRSPQPSQRGCWSVREGCQVPAGKAASAGGLRAAARSSSHGEPEEWLRPGRGDWAACGVRREGPDVVSACKHSTAQHRHCRFLMMLRRKQDLQHDGETRLSGHRGLCSSSSIPTPLPDGRAVCTGVFVSADRTSDEEHGYRSSFSRCLVKEKLFKKMLRHFESRRASLAACGAMHSCWS